MRWMSLRLPLLIALLLLALAGLCSAEPDLAHDEAYYCPRRAPAPLSGASMWAPPSRPVILIPGTWIYEV